MLKVVRAARSLAATELPILITGDSGTGKSLLARVIHRLSPRADGPFLGQNASTVPPELFEADLFGYERGAFTGAERARTGFLFQATEGTFHLEEVGDMDLPIQLRLLRVIEEKTVRPVGATSSRHLDVRFIASTQRDLDAMVRRGEFRKDLFYRLNGARIHLPSLHQRKEEIEPLAAHYWHELTGSTRQFTATALQVLKAHDWPGNVRELLSVLRRLSIETATTPTTAEVQNALGETKSAQLFPGNLFESRDFEEVERLLERSYLEHLLGKHGDLEAIAAALGTTTRSVYRRFERLGLKPKHMKRETR
jgi:two-component system response regulator GlrR